MPKRYTEL